MNWLNLNLIPRFSKGESEFLGDCYIRVDSDILNLAGDFQYRDEFDLGGTNNADAIILLFHSLAVRNINKEINIEVYGEPYWFYHDLIHTRQVFETGKLNVNIDSEHEALVLGSLLAFKNGVALDDIVRQLVLAEPEYKTRFGTPGVFLKEFLQVKYGSLLSKL